MATGESHFADNARVLAMAILQQAAEDVKQGDDAEALAALKWMETTGWTWMDTLDIGFDENKLRSWIRRERALRHRRYELARTRAESKNAISIRLLRIAMERAGLDPETKGQTQAIEEAYESLMKTFQ